MRTFVSQKFDTHGTRRPPGVATRMKNGTSPTHAAPSKVSAVSPSGSRRCTLAGSNGQCRNVSRSHRCRMIGRSMVNGQAPRIRVVTAFSVRGQKFSGCSGITSVVMSPAAASGNSLVMRSAAA